MDLSRTNLDFVRLDKKVFVARPEDSIEYAVLKHVSDGVVTPLDGG